MNIKDRFPLGLTGLFSLQSKGLFKSLLQHHNSKASILQHSDFFMVQLSHPYMTTEKTITLTIWTFVGKAMSLLFNMHSFFKTCESLYVWFSFLFLICKVRFYRINPMWFTSSFSENLVRLYYKVINRPWQMVNVKKCS